MVETTKTSISERNSTAHPKILPVSSPTQDLKILIIPAGIKSTQYHLLTCSYLDDYLDDRHLLVVGNVIHFNFPSRIGQLILDRKVKTTTPNRRSTKKLKQYLILFQTNVPRLAYLGMKTLTIYRARYISFRIEQELTVMISCVFQDRQLCRCSQRLVRRATVKLSVTPSAGLVSVESPTKSSSNSLSRSALSYL